MEDYFLNKFHRFFKSDLIDFDSDEDPQITFVCEDYTEMTVRSKQTNEVLFKVQQYKNMRLVSIGGFVVLYKNQNPEYYRVKQNHNEYIYSTKSPYEKRASITVNNLDQRIITYFNNLQPISVICEIDDKLFHGTQFNLSHNQQNEIQEIVKMIQSDSTLKWM